MTNVFDFDDIYGIENIEIDFDDNTGEFSISGIAKKNMLMYKALSAYKEINSNEEPVEESPQQEIIRKCRDKFFKDYAISYDGTIWNKNSLRDAAVKIIVKENPTKMECFLFYIFDYCTISKQSMSEYIFNNAALKAGFEKVMTIRNTDYEEFNYTAFLKDGENTYKAVFFNL